MFDIETKRNKATSMLIFLILMAMKHVESFTQPQNKNPFVQSTLKSYEWEGIKIKSKDYFKQQFTHLSITFKNNGFHQSSLYLSWNTPDYFSMESLPSPFRSFGGWYNEVDATPASVVYNE